MKGQKTNGLLLNGSLKKSGITFYQRDGQTVARSAHSDQPRRRTRKQFVARQHFAHSSRLWKMLMLDGYARYRPMPTEYARFRSLMRRTPVVFVPRRGPEAGATLLLPQLPVSDGILPVVGQWLGEVEGVAALLTDLAVDDLGVGDSLRLFALRQCVEGGRPTVRVRSEAVGVEEMVEVDGRLALVDERFADAMCGWALVRSRGAQCSSQAVVSRCTYYERFTTEEALQAAAASYGGLTPSL